MISDESCRFHSNNNAILSRYELGWLFNLRGHEVTKVVTPDQSSGIYLCICIAKDMGHVCIKFGAIISFGYKVIAFWKFLLKIHFDNLPDNPRRFWWNAVTGNWTPAPPDQCWSICCDSAMLQRYLNIERWGEGKGKLMFNNMPWAYKWKSSFAMLTPLCAKIPTHRVMYSKEIRRKLSECSECKAIGKSPCCILSHILKTTWVRIMKLSDKCLYIIKFKYGL